ncbi:acetate--CoA ligase family protein [Peribacillus sp. NPDC058002]|uniref:acetate--CoA ligase family protein n=1 Tax=Peribacillus sp. NPDC058002 TaxID=3346301 RepID=UPI0036DA3E6C
MGKIGLETLLDPKNIAVIGASTNPNKISGRSIHYLNSYGYKGDIYPINPKYSEVLGHKCYKDILDVPFDIDLAIIIISAQNVIKMVKSCVKKKVKSCIIFSSGFAEMGEEGRLIQEEISQLAKTENIRIVGPNCQGVSNLKTKSMTSFSTSFADEKLYYGKTAILSQSGAVAAMAYNIQKEFGKGTKYWIATGNESDVNVSELINHIIDDNDVKVIQAYFEDVKDSDYLVSAAKKANKLNKPILALKPGKSEEAKRAASSHTGALAGEDIVFDAICKHYGIVRVDDIMEFSTFPQIFELDQKASGKKVAILTNSGGLGVMLVDKCKEMGLEIANFNTETKKKLEEVLPVFAAIDNPIDLTAQLLNDKHLLSQAFPILMKDQNVDIILVAFSGIGKGYDISKIVEDITAAHNRGEKILAVAWVASLNGVASLLGENGVPVFTDPTLMVKGVSKFTEYSINKEMLDEEIEQFPSVSWNLPFESQHTDGFLNEYESKQILKHHGLSISNEVLAADKETAKEAAAKIGYPVVAKIASQFIQHKTEIGGVKINIQNEAQLAEAYQTIYDNSLKIAKEEQLDGILVQEMVEKNFEISLGLKNDPIFGPVIMVASGGIYIEVMKDFQMLVPPVNYKRAKKAVNSLMMAPLLNGVRGKAKLDVDALCKTIVSFSKMIEAYQHMFEEIDINPIIVREEGKGVKIVDALIKLKPSHKNIKNGNECAYARI